jgi:pilus assembly protein Flp/PilA
MVPFLERRLPHLAEFADMPRERFGDRFLPGRKTGRTPLQRFRDKRDHIGGKFRPQLGPSVDAGCGTGKISEAKAVRGIYAWLRAGRLRQSMNEFICDFLADETGATAIEDGLIAAGISLAMIAIVNNLGITLKTKFTSINTSLK